jgi:hypothetical protein
MRHEHMLALYDREMRIDAPLPGRGFRYERSDTVVRLIGPSPAVYDNCVLYSRLDAQTADAAIAQTIADFRSAMALNGNCTSTIRPPISRHV